jgi:hypothetical protein
MPRPLSSAENSSTAARTANCDREETGTTEDECQTGAERPPQKYSVASIRGRELGFVSVMSASVKPRLAGRQPSNRGGVPRVIDQVE